MITTFREFNLIRTNFGTVAISNAVLDLQFLELKFCHCVTIFNTSGYGERLVDLLLILLLKIFINLTRIYEKLNCKGESYSLSG